jgi:hypothetical protein
MCPLDEMTPTLAVSAVAMSLAWTVLALFSL